MRATSKNTPGGPTVACSLGPGIGISASAGKSLVAGHGPSSAVDPGTPCLPASLRSMAWSLGTRSLYQIGEDSSIGSAPPNGEDDEAQHPPSALSPEPILSGVGSASMDSLPLTHVEDRDRFIRPPSHHS